MTIKEFLKKYIVFGCLGQIVFSVGLVILATIIDGGKPSKDSWATSILSVIFCIWLLGAAIGAVDLALTSPSKKAKTAQIEARAEIEEQARLDWETAKAEWDETHCLYCRQRLEDGAVRCAGCGASRK